MSPLFAASDTPPKAPAKKPMTCICHSFKNATKRQRDGLLDVYSINLAAAVLRALAVLCNFVTVALSVDQGLTCTVAFTVIFPATEAAKVLNAAFDLACCSDPEPKNKAK